MWCLEVINHINEKKIRPLPITLIKEQMTQLNFKLHSYKVLQDPIFYNDNHYNYIVPATRKGMNFINKMLANPEEALFIQELDVYLV